MPIDWEQTFREWSKPSSDNEAERQENALSMVKDAVCNYEPLKERKISFIPQGSYHNNTNVRQESDVDICVCCRDPYFVDFSKANYTSVQGEVDTVYTFFNFKTEIEAALKSKFGSAGYTRRSKAFNVHPNGYRVSADVVAALELREYLPSNLNPPVATYTEPPGIKFICDGSYKTALNWPEQHHVQGVLKNVETGSRFKYIVRALKRMKYYMGENGKPEMAAFPSFLVECLVYRAPKSHFDGDSYYDNVKWVLAHAIVGTMEEKNSSDWYEVNGKKLLFGTHQPWTVKQAYDFCLAAWTTVGF